MIQIATSTFTGDITSKIEVFSHAGFNTLMEVILRLELQNIVGNGVYRLYFNTAAGLLVPITSVSVPSGTTDAFMMSREIVLQAGEAFSIDAQGQGGDTAVTVVTRIYDVTPVSNAQIVGAGAVVVNHDYPTTDDMLIVDGANAPVAGACIYIYTKADYEAGRTGPEYIVARSTSTTTGEWEQPVNLNAGDYYAYIFKHGATVPQEFEFTVV
jgi:hypothetical protein